MGILEETVKGKKYYFLSILLILMEVFVFLRGSIPQETEIKIQRIMTIPNLSLLISWNLLSLSIWILLLVLLKNLRFKNLENNP